VLIVAAYIDSAKPKTMLIRALWGRTQLQFSALIHPNGCIPLGFTAGGTHNFAAALVLFKVDVGLRFLQSHCLVLVHTPSQGLQTLLL
jgi:hypothetical protein